MKVDTAKTPPNNSDDSIRLLYDCYNLAADVTKRIKVTDENYLQVATTCLFIKMLNCTRAILFLMKENLIAEAHVLLRHYMEACVLLILCRDDENFLKEYILSDIATRLKLGNVIINNPECFGGEKAFDITKVKTLNVELKGIVDKDGIREIKAEELFNRAGLKSHYNTVYRLLSGITHIRVLSLDEYLVLNDDNEVSGFTLYPYQKDSSRIYVTCNGLIIKAIEYMSSIFKIDTDEKLQQLEQRFREIHHLDSQQT